MIYKIERLFLLKLLERRTDRTNFFNSREGLSFPTYRCMLAAFATAVRLYKKNEEFGGGS